MLLLAEYLLVSLRFDSQPRMHDGGVWSVLGRLGSIGPVVLAVTTAVLLLGGTDLRTRLSQVGLAAMQPRLPWRALVLHGVLFGCLWLLTGYIFDDALPEIGPPWLWLTAWLLAAGATIASAIHVACPLPSLLAFGRSAARAGLAGVGVGLAAWAAGVASAELWLLPLSDATLFVVERLLSLRLDAVYIDYADRIIGTPTFAVIIAPVCSGYEGIGLIGVFLIVYLWTSRTILRFPHALVLLPVGIAAVWIGNAVRIAALITLGSMGAPELAHGGFHSKAGWLIFCAIALGLVALSQRVDFFRSPQARASQPAVSAVTDTTSPHLAAPCLVPLLVVISTVLITGLFTADFDYLYPLRVFAAAAALVWYRHSYPSVDWSWAWAPPILGIAAYLVWRLLESAGDASLSHAWEARLFALPAPLWVGWLTLRTLGTVVTIPIVEELAFRGYLLRRLVSSDVGAVPLQRFYPLATLLSSLAFGALHQRWVAGSLAGLLYAYALSRRGRVGDAIIAHAVTNALLAAEVLITRRWWLWL